MATTKTELYNNGTLVATKTSAPFNTFDWTPANGEVGSASLTVKRYEDGVLVATSAAVGGTVNASSGTYDTDYQAVLDYATANGIAHPDTAQKDIDNQLLIDYKATGAWAKDDVFFKFKGTAPSAFKLIDWKRLTQATAVGGLTWNNTGVKGNGTDSYIDPAFTPNGTGNFKLNDAHIGYVNTVNSIDNTQTQAVAAVYSGSLDDYTLVRAYKNDGAIGINGGAVTTSSFNTLGYHSLDRISSSQLKLDNGTAITSNAVAINPSTVFILARKKTGGADYFSTQELSYFTMGADKSTLYTQIKTVLE
jgi:hypothetical protein